MPQPGDATPAGNPEQRIFDVLVIGGGINGAAIARDAALRGLSVCIVEMRDWGAGTSAKSSKLAHGGLRYLEQFEFALVHEALHERESLLRYAPHLVRPLRFLYPLYPHTAARRTVRMGLWLYDQLSRGKSLPRRRYLSARRVLELAPGLSEVGLAGGATFFDAQIHHVERLVAEMITDARAHGAEAYNHTRVEYLQFERDAGRRRVTGAHVEDEAGGHRLILARAVVNASGCWVDEVLGPLGQDQAPKIRKNKGIHVVVPRFLDVAVMVRAKDGRNFFILPWQNHSVLGTTDTNYEGDPYDAVAEPDEVRYLVDAARQYFPHAPLEDIQFTYAGVRALVNEPGVTESNVTRRHVIYDHAARDAIDGLWTLQGGKITTARRLAEETVNRIAHSLGRRDLGRMHPTRTARYPGGTENAWDEFRVSAIADAVALGIDGRSAQHLVDTYGAKWQAVVESDPRPASRRPVHPDHPHLGCELTFAVRHEQAIHLGDAILRRTDLGMGAEGEPDAALRALDWMSEQCGWDKARSDAEWRGYLLEVQQFAVPVPPPALAPPL